MSEFYHPVHIIFIFAHIKHKKCYIHIREENMNF